MRSAFLIFIIWALWTGMTCADSRARDVKEGNRLFEKGDYASSIEKYSQALKEDPESEIVNYDIGTAYYKNKEYRQAIAHLQKSLLSEDDMLKENAYYNLGNAFYKIGIGLEDQDINAAVTSLQKSLAQYEGALKVDPQDEDAKFNYEFVKKELERLQKKQQQQQKQCPCKKQQQQRQKQQQKQDQQKSRQDQKDQQRRQEDQEKQQGQQQGQQNEKKDQESNQQNEKLDQPEPGTKDQGRRETSASRRAPIPLEPDQMTKQEAEKLLQRYQQTEEPRRLLNLHKDKAREAPVLKDW